MSLLTQNIIVGIIILAAIAWIVVKLIRARKKGSAGCCGCSMSASCPHLGEATSPKSPCRPGEAISPKSPCCPGEATSPKSPCCPEEAISPKSPCRPGEAISPKSPCGCPHCAADKESAEICCSVRCPGGNGAVSTKNNPHENNQNLE